MFQRIWNRVRRPIVLTISPALCLIATATLCDGQVVESGGPESYTLPDVPAEVSDATDLDKLLDLAESDVGRLTNVKVSHAPSLDVEVTTVSRQKSTVGRSPAAIFVLTNEMIRRSGATSVPEALRQVPGVNVAKIDANKWAISIRGFNDRFANKLLVQIDGRSVYTPLFGGVLWDVQDVLLEDVERIEVIRGPGATVWGANAVNGIINVITKSSAQTQGVYAQGGAGTEERGFGNGRYGGQLGDNATYRVYGKWFERDRGYDTAGNAKDDWRMGRMGFRTDWTPSQEDTVTFQGDAYEGTAGSSGTLPSFAPPFSQRVAEDSDLSGGNGLLRWSRVIDEEHDWSVQAYYDRTAREFGATGFREDRDTVDVDFQNRFAVGDRHSIIWGGGYRNTRDSIRNNAQITYLPNKRSIDLFSYFLQDQITLQDDRWYLTLGSKFNHSDFTPFEYQPTARLLWTPTERHSLWTSVSRAVRLPTRTDQDIQIALPTNPTLPGIFPVAQGQPSFISEQLLAYEAGIRVQPTEWFSWDLAGFYNRYDDLQGLVMGVPFPGPPPFVIVPQIISNIGSAQTYGFEYGATYQLTENWKLYGNYSLLKMDVDNVSAEGRNPQNQVYFQSGWNFAQNWEFDAIWRYVDHLPEYGIRSYNTMDMRVAWCPRERLEIAAVGRNLLDSHHFERPTDQYLGTFATQIQREFYGTVTFRY